MSEAPLVVSVQLLTGAYEAGDAGDPRLAEWPPHPARLFCALVAAARDEEDRAMLGWLERQPPPSVWADERAETLTHSAYVVTNTVEASGGSQTHPGRTNGRRDRAAAYPPSSRLAFVWPGVDPPAGAVPALDRMARRIPYLGRSSGVALVAATVGVAPPDDGVAFDPCDLSEAEVSLRVPFPGYLHELDALFEGDQPAWQAARFLGYRVRRPQERAVEPVVPSVYSDVVIFGFAGLRPEGRLAGWFTQALRAEVLRRAGRPSPAPLHGHGADGRPHVAFLALPHVGAEHAGGHLLGLAVAVPDLPSEERRAVMSAVLALREPGSGLCSLPVPGVGEVELSYRPGLVRPWGLRPERWRRGSSRWVSATPVVLDRYPKDGDVVAEVRRSCRMVGLPDPVGVAVSRDPLLPGAVALRPQELPPKLRGRLYRHVALTFDRTVAGPVLLGAGRYLGIGLLAPLSDRQPADDAPVDGAGAQTAAATGRRV